MLLPLNVQAQSCTGQGVEGDLSGSADTAVIVGRASPPCFSQQVSIKRQPSVFYTLEIKCSKEQQAALEGLCSATPCPTSFFALRTAHFPDGRSEPAGFQCVTTDQVVAPRANRCSGLRGGKACEAPGWRDWSESYGTGFGEPPVLL